MPELNETICALSTAPGRAGIAVVRLSGGESVRIAREVFVPEQGGDPLPARRSVLGRVLDPRGGELDQALVTLFPGPRSYTGEDLVEISLHGSPVLVAAVLDALCARGARLAEPGEFTLRAFAHGRLDLAQAEAVRDMIEAKTLYQARVAARQRDGSLSRAIAPVRELLLDVIVQLESAVEFVEESLALEPRAHLLGKVRQAGERVAQWAGSFRRGRFIREGFEIAVVGRPNAGKSSLFNALLAEERSIVTEVPGTTRDLVSESTSFGGIPVRLVDTAGLRTAGDRIEQLGIERSYRAIADADAVVLVVDQSAAVSPDDEILRDRLGESAAAIAFNKADLPGTWSAAERERFAGPRPFAVVSALTGAGLDALHEVIECQLIGGAADEEGVVVTNLRHCQALEGAAAALGQGAALLEEGASEELVLVELHAGLRRLGEITGETTVEDLLGQIFARFCVGK
jgi:tRNA modification GTPase